MIRLIQYTLFSALLITLCSTATPIQAGTYETVQPSLTEIGKESGFEVDKSGKPKHEFAVAFSRYINGMLTIMGALFFVLMVYAGYLWMWAHGNETQIERAKKMMLGAIIGLGIIIGGRIIAEVTFDILDRGFTVEESES